MPEGFTVPNVVAQIALLKTVYAEAGVDPLTVDFVEAHGTGTAVGDPIETPGPRRGAGPGPDAGQSLLDRLGEDQPRPSGRGGGDRRLHQGRF